MFDFQAAGNLVQCFAVLGGTPEIWEDTQVARGLRGVQHRFSATLYSSSFQFNKHL